jgi:hypothetical protein
LPRRQRELFRTTFREEMLDLESGGVSRGLYSLNTGLQPFSASSFAGLLKALEAKEK